MRKKKLDKPSVRGADRFHAPRLGSLSGARVPLVVAARKAKGDGPRNQLREQTMKNKEGTKGLMPVTRGTDEGGGGGGAIETSEGNKGGEW